MKKPFLNAGVSCASIHYRWKLDVPVPDILRDCARAVQWLRAHAAENNLDPKRVAAWGGSAGACAALWLGTREDLASPNERDAVLRQSSRLSAVVLTATQATLDPTRWQSFVEKPRPEWVPEIEKSALALFHLGQMSELESPRIKAILAEYDMLQLISRDDAPIFCINASPDGPSRDLGHWFHHPRHAAEIQKSAQAAGLECAVHPGRGAPAEQAAIEFVLRHLKVK
jgi:acetyl esterase/lipase